MADPPGVVTLPAAVESLLRTICSEKCQPYPVPAVLHSLALCGEMQALQILETISTEPIRHLSGYLMHLIRKHAGEGGIPFPDNLGSGSHRCPAVKTPNHFSTPLPVAKRQRLSPPSTTEIETNSIVSPQLLALSELQFRKAFLLLSYLGSKKLEDVMSADEIIKLKDHPMTRFELEVWKLFGRRRCAPSERLKYSDWDSGKTYLYHCHVSLDGTYSLKGPYLSPTRTHLQRVLGDDNVLVVKFAEDTLDNAIRNSTEIPQHYYDLYRRTAEEGILVGLRCYRFFVFKDGGREDKQKNPTSSSVRCYFVRMESLAPSDQKENYILSDKSVSEARRYFMHVDMVSSMAKYMARFSLVLSKTVKLPVDLSSVSIQRINDIVCSNENGDTVRNKDGEPLIHTDGTGFISQDLASRTPKDFSKAKFIDNNNFERFLDVINCIEESPEVRQPEARTKEPPLLMQVRLFNEGCAVKGTLLVDKRLPPRTICVRPSMIKVETDPSRSGRPTCNSLEIVGISNKPRITYLSRYLITLLNYGGVPKDYFVDLVTNALEEAQNVYSNKRAALRVALSHGEIDDDFNVARMILSGVPLNEPFLQYRLSVLAKEERKGLQGGKVPINESFYLMGTVDPTGLLKSNEVFVVLENGPIHGDVLVYRNPGLHFGDIHKLKAVQKDALQDVIGNSKYGIFFSTKGPRNAASEIANGDFDGDIYWVSRNPELLDNFKVSDPWSCEHPTPSARSIKPGTLSDEEIEQEMFRLFIKTRFQRSTSMSVAADSWLAFMDRLLVLGDDSADEKEGMKKKMQALVDVYYDALDAPKTGKKVDVKDSLRVEKYPHYMGRDNSYHSTSVLGLIYETVKSFQSEDFSAGIEVSKLPCFDVDIPSDCENLWSKRYHLYKQQMTEAMNSDPETRNDRANEVIKDYKQLLYGADGFEESTKKTEDLYMEALAIYHVTYNWAMNDQDVKKCRFAWKVAGPVLCKYFALKQSDKSEKLIACSPSVLREIFG